ncbi:DMT family transporter [Nitratifractor sp.]|uniref:DMT family transporter n=1 Tax=Nitratifractor sp. TaxID=2268144 RepID=UPI0025E5B44A|nr:DMT family transporter [Nitratifractor sp.]
MKDEKSLGVFYALMVLAMLGWGASWVHVKYLAERLSIHEIIFYRYGLTTLSMFPLLWMMKLSLRIDLRSFFSAFVAAGIMILYTWLFIAGTHLGTAGLGGAFVTTLIPILTFGLMAVWHRKRLSRRQILALTLGAIGVMTILNVWSFHIEQIFRLENLYFILAAASWAVLTIVSSRGSDTHPLVFSFWLYALVTLLEGLFLTRFETDLSAQPPLVDLNLILLALFSTTFATSIYFIGGQKLGADRISSFTFLVPFSAIGLSAIFLGESVNAGMIVGTAMAVGAIKMLNKG